MNQFTILANESWLRTREGNIGLCLQHDTTAYYHSDYVGGQGRYRQLGTIENLICTFKNDITRYSDEVLKNAMNNLSMILAKDFLDILKSKNIATPLTVCVIPRAKQESYYRDDQKLFRLTINNVINIFNKNGIDKFINGTHNIIRHTNTMTTHLSHNPFGNGGDGEKPYCGITKSTCRIADVKGKNILLIDDLYTKTVCIDEDAIQALYDNGANNVLFYSVGKTISKY